MVETLTYDDSERSVEVESTAALKGDLRGGITFHDSRTRFDGIEASERENSLRNFTESFPPPGKESEDIANRRCGVSGIETRRPGMRLPAAPHL